MVDQDQQVRSYVHLAQMPRATDALRMLKHIASAVKPIMRSHGWRVGELAEFYPNDANLLGAVLSFRPLYGDMAFSGLLGCMHILTWAGLNVNRGQQICIRLRYANDKTLFLGLDMVIDTMLHELCHNVHGPHNGAFHALWEKLRDEHLTLSLSGYSGASFLSEGRRLGGGAAAVPARERGRISSSRGGAAGSGVAVAGRRLGGSIRALTPDMRRAAAAEAAERRKRALEGCGADKLDDTQMRDLGETARRNGFRTQAEEDHANDVAIAQALAELHDSHGQTPRRTPSAGSSRSTSTRTSTTRTNTTKASTAPNRTAPAARSRLVTMLEGGNRGSRREDTARVDRNSGGTTGWVCSACTLYNPGECLRCDACENKRKTTVEPPVVIDLT